jgi:hypothetical protein
MDKLVIWAYLDLDNYPPEYLYDIGVFLKQFETDRIILSIGLWSNQASVITPDKLRRAIVAADQGEMPNIWITPFSLLQAGHWAVLEELWGRSYRYGLPVIIQ